VSDCYDGQDLLADVFEGTEDAPLPVARTSPVDGRVMGLRVAPDDRRWRITPFGVYPANPEESKR
jgi:hypothetical protein